MQWRFWGGVSARHTESTRRGWPGVRPASDRPVCWTAVGEGILGWGLGSSFSVSVWLCSVFGGHMEMHVEKHIGDLLSSHDSGTGPGGRAGFCSNACHTPQAAPCWGTPAGRCRPGGLSASSGRAVSSSHSSCSSGARLACAASPDMTRPHHPYPKSPP